MKTWHKIVGICAVLVAVFLLVGWTNGQSVGGQNFGGRPAYGQNQPWAFVPVYGGPRGGYFCGQPYFRRDVGPAWWYGRGGGFFRPGIRSSGYGWGGGRRWFNGRGRW